MDRLLLSDQERSSSQRRRRRFKEKIAGLSSEDLHQCLYVTQINWRRRFSVSRRRSLVSDWFLSIIDEKGNLSKWHHLAQTDRTRRSSFDNALGRCIDYHEERAKGKRKGVSRSRLSPEKRLPFSVPSLVC